MGYSTPHRKKELFEDLKKNGFQIRELYFIDVSIPLDKNYNKSINYFKHFVMSWYWGSRNPLKFKFPMSEILIKQLEKATGYKQIKFNRDDWDNDTKHKLLYSLLCPLMFQDVSTRLTTKEEKDNLKQLETFSSKGYKPILKTFEDKNMDLSRLKK